MHPANPAVATGRAASRGLTLTELLVTLAVLGILAAILIPVVSAARGTALRSSCATHLRQLGIALTQYGTENRERLPANLGDGAWAWDIRYDFFSLIGLAGDLKDLAYCPAGLFPEKESLWEGFRSVGVHGYRAIGYVILLKNTPGIDPNDWNERLSRPVVNGIELHPGERPLAVDATLARGDNFDSVLGGVPTAHRANHLNGGKPTGGNILFLDAHVAWRPFSAMRNHVVDARSPDYWW